MEMPGHIQRLTLALGYALILLLAGCGVTATGGASGPQSATSPATATAASHAAATQTAATSGATSGPVTLTVGSAQYAASDRIVVTIHNGSGAPIYAQQHNTSCSMILLERLVNDVWQPVYPCVNGFPHPTVGRVAAASALVVQLVPIVSGDAEATGGVQWPAGTYRATLLYTTNQATAFSQGTAAYSTTFTIG